MTLLTEADGSRDSVGAPDKEGDTDGFLEILGVDVGVKEREGVLDGCCCGENVNNQNLHYY